MKKRITKLLALVCFIIVCFILRYYGDLLSFSYLTTNYLDEGTNIVKITPFAIKKSNTFNMKCVEKEYIINGEKVLADRYGNKLVVINGRETKYYKFDEYNIVDIASDCEFIYLLFNVSANKSKILKLDKNYNLIDESLEFEGNPRNFLIIEDNIFVASNILKSPNDNKVILNKISAKTLDLEKSVFLESMSFVFRISEIDRELLIFGNFGNIDYKLLVSKFDKNLKLKLDKKYNEKALWVNKILLHKENLIVQNEFSIIFLDKSNLEILNVYEKNKLALLDVIIKKNWMYVLSLNIESGESYIYIVDVKTLKDIKNYKLEVGLENSNDVPSSLIDDL